MNAIAVRLVASAVALLAIVAGVLYVRELRSGLAGAQLEASQAKGDLAARDETIRRLQDDAADKAKQQRKLDADRTGIDTKLAGIQHDVRKPTDENAEFRAWASGALPADVIRMHTSPPLTGAADYLARVPGGDTLHAAGDDTDH
ncbi:Rz-like lysis system protein LysB [Paraburkholderia phenazinium]|uniref:Rz-like lysis system protein LysB n=1 Tax=Paraburkholderia phenazinium TaxID=60549 RepID=UPI00158CD47A|nr:Rz-like lysis system protein LysB [Paraburkholderia phenazinium]